MTDLYSNFADLRDHEAEGIDYRICVTERQSLAAIIAPNGGLIEPRTSEIAAAIADNVHGLYCFEGLRIRPHWHLHITSTKFDEPKCLRLIGRCEFVVAVHGLAGPHSEVDVGGLDFDLRDAICANLKAADFKSNVVKTGSHAAVLQNNICNKGMSGQGVQLEITRGLRDALLSGDEDLNAFADSVRKAIPSRQPN